MTEQNDRRTYPRITANQWWTLRDRFKSAPPRTAVTASFLSLVFNISEKSAAADVLPALKILGLLDSDGKPTDLVDDWRSDDQAAYESVCETIRERVYPPELLDAAPPTADLDMEVVRSWFMRSARVGISAARKMASTYQLLAEADLSKRDVRRIRRKSSPKVSTPKELRPNNVPAEEAQAQLRAAAGHRQSQSGHEKSLKVDPSVHIDIQIHISPESSDKQIETIFANMAKHLYGISTKDGE